MRPADSLLNDRILSAGRNRRAFSMVTLRIADIVVRLVTRDLALPLAAGGAADRFVTDGTGSVDLTLHASVVDSLHEPSGARLFDSGAAWRLYPHGNGFLFSFHSTTLARTPYRLAKFDAHFTIGDVALTREFVAGYPQGVPALQYPLDELVWSNLLARGRGVEIHACGVIDSDGYGILFPGQSGAGKSTISRPWIEHGATVVSDDRVILRMREGRPWLYGTPWHGDEQLAAPAAAPLKQILFLARGSVHTIRPLTPAVAAARLFSCAFPPFHDPTAIDFTAALLGKIASSVQCAELAFVPDATVVPFVRESAR